MHLQKPMRKYFAVAVTNLHLPQPWINASTADTEHYRSIVFARALKGPTLAYQLLCVKLRGCPWLWFRLLQDPSHATATRILQTPQCLQDELSRHLCRSYPTVEDLMHNSDLHQFLAAIGLVALFTTHSTERAHSTNLKHARTAQTHRKSVEELALAHQAVAAPSWLQQAWASGHARAHRCKRKKAEPLDAEQEARAAGPLRRRKGGGGAWRAYQFYQRKVVNAISSTKRMDRPGYRKGGRYLSDVRDICQIKVGYP